MFDGKDGFISPDNFSIETKGDQPFQNDGSQAIHVDSLGHGLYAFINGELAGVPFNQILLLLFFAFGVTTTIYHLTFY